MKRFILPAFLAFSITVHAQYPGGMSQQMNLGHFYGRVIDSLTGKGIEYATVRLFQSALDSIHHSKNEKLITGALTGAAGDFEMNELPVMGDFTLRITALGYDSLDKKVSFGIKPKQGNMQQMMTALDKDLGNIALTTSAVQLGEVVVTDDEPLYSVQLDKKVYNVAKDPMSAGTTADEVLKNVPSVTVDIDGNVSLRSAAPQIFVDGRPTTLTLDQIPSDAIEKIEVITNPSAKYDASGSQSGIINIVLKHSKRIGYMGNIRGGVDMRGKINGGGDLNVRQGKVNVFGNGNYFQRKTIGYGETIRNSFYSDPNTYYLQHDSVTNTGHFIMANLGLDYFVNNRNTITLSGTYNNGNFNPLTDIYITTDSLYDSSTVTRNSYRNSDLLREFKNGTGTFQYKHLFPQEGKEWTADLNYTKSNSTVEAHFYTVELDENSNPLPGTVKEMQNGSGENEFFTTQTDFTDPVSENIKIEAGARAAIRNYLSDYHTYTAPDGTEDYTEVPSIGSYEYNDQVYAGYATFSNKIKKFQYQAGLRLESSFYSGELRTTGQVFENNFPASLFPSGYVTYSLNEESDLQLTYSRKIDRPGFFQLIPSTDYSDSLNLQRGNPGLKPQFTNSGEISYEKRFDRGNNFTATAYYKYINEIMTRYQVFEQDTFFDKGVIINTYANANSSQTYGLELSSINSIKTWLTISSSLNLFQYMINGSNLESDLENNRFSWIAKLNATFKLPLNFTFQLTSDYQAKTNSPQSSGGGMWRGLMGGSGAMWSGGSSGTIQGYVNPIYGVDVSLKKEFLKAKAASVTLSFSDIFRTRENETFTNSSFFTQSTARIRDPQFVRLNFSLKFGKFDASLFKRKNLRNNNGEMIQDMGM